MKLFEEISLDNFPAEECNIPLKINGNFFRAEKKRMVLIYIPKEDTLQIKNLYPCLGETNRGDSFGFVADNELEYYSFENKDYLLKGMSETCNIELFIEDLKNNFL